MYRIVFVLGFLLPGSGIADPAAVYAAAVSRFPAMPAIAYVDSIMETCGADETVDVRVAYCTTSNRIFVARGALNDRAIDYLVGHAFGHAVQVRHGVADVALAAIRSRPAEEVMLRGLVERQVDCIAGFLLGQAGLPLPDVSRFFSTDPLGQRHWGRDPLNVGPRATVGIEDRAEWVARGYSGDLTQCAVGEFGTDLLVDALKP